MTSHATDVLVTELYPSLCNPMEHSPPGSSVLGILQARITGGTDKDAQKSCLEGLQRKCPRIRVPPCLEALQTPSFFSSCLHSLLLPPPLLASTCVIWWNFNSCLLLRSLIHAQQSALWFSFCSLVPKREKKLWDKLFPDAPPNSETRCSTKQ